VVPNTILIGETEKSENFLEFAELVRLVRRSRKNLIVMRERRKKHGEGEGQEERRHVAGDRRPSTEEKPVRQRIDVWWKGRSNNIAFILAVALLMRRSPEWAKARLMIRMVVESREEAIEYEKRLEEFVVKERLKAETETILRQERDVYDIIRASSQGADFVFLGIRMPGDEESAEEYSEYYRRLLEETRDLPPTALLMAAEQIEFWRMFRSSSGPG
jgi:hypothetical protein